MDSISKCHKCSACSLFSGSKTRVLESMLHKILFYQVQIAILNVVEIINIQRL